MQVQTGSGTGKLNNNFLTTAAKIQARSWPNNQTDTRTHNLCNEQDLTICYCKKPY